MSVFRVNLNNGDQGKLDIDPTAGTQFSTSKQRTVYVMGPGTSTENCLMEQLLVIATIGSVFPIQQRLVKMLLLVL